MGLLTLARRVDSVRRQRWLLGGVVSRWSPQMADPYKELAMAFADDGIRCHFQSSGQMVVSGQVGPIWPNRGNSFWVTNVAGRWYVFTWVPVGYRVPDSVDMAELCRTCMAHGDSAMAKVPAEIANEFGLVELSEVEAEFVIREMSGKDQPRSCP